MPLTSPSLTGAFLTTRTTWEAPGSAQVTAKPTLPIFHNDLTVGVPIGQSQGVPMHIILRPNEAALSPFYCLENWGLAKLSDLQVSGDVRYKPRFSESKANGLSTTEQLPLDTRGGCGKQGLPRTLPSLLVDSIWSEGHVSRVGVPQLPAHSSLCKFKETEYEFKELNLKNWKSSYLLEVMGKWRLKCDEKACKDPYLLPSNLSFFLLFSVRPINRSFSIAMSSVFICLGLLRQHSDPENI